MRTVSIPKTIGMVWLLACCFTSSSVFALGPHAREIHGVILSIDLQKRSLTLTHVQEPGSRNLIWNSDTQFLRGGKSFPATELKPGSTVTVYYHAPFFGKPFATKITCLGDNGQ